MSVTTKKPAKSLADEIYPNLPKKHNDYNQLYMVITKDKIDMLRKGFKEKKPAKSWHWADVEKSERLKRVVDLLKDGKVSGLKYLLQEKFSAREIAWYACVNSGPSVLAELRKNGIEVKSESVKGSEGTYKVYWIEK